jgi:hypothetical protein
VDRPPVVLNVWSGAATVLAVAALVALVSVLSGPYSRDDLNIFYSLGPTLLAGSTFFAALVLIERDDWLIGFPALLATPFGWLMLIYGLWYEATSSASADAEFWTGIIVLVTLAAAWGDEQFWRVGAAITSLWIVATALVFLVAVAERARRSDLWLVAGALLVGTAVFGVAATLTVEFESRGYSIFFTLISAVLTTTALTGGVVALEHGARVVGWIAVVASPIAFAMLADGIWRDSEDRFRFVATGVVVALALLVALSARLFAQTPALIRLADVAGGIAGLTALVSIEAIWRDDRYFLAAEGTTALWILAILCCLLVPVLDRYRATAAEPALEAPA